MSNLKKCIFSIIAVFVLFNIAFYNVSQAMSLNAIKSGSNVGATTSISYSTLLSRNDLYCVQHSASLKNGAHTYYVKKYIEINGNTATDTSTNTSINSTYNGILAYIISKDGGYGVQNGYSASQMGIYAVINDWYTNVGSQLGISWPSRGNNVAPNSYYNEGKEYANSIGDTTSISQPVDNTDQSNIKVEAYKYSDGISYVRVGPFNWSFTGTFDEITIQGDEGQSLYINNTSKNNLWISRYEGNNEVWINPNQMVSGQNFYLTIRADSGIKAIRNIQARGQQVTDGIINAKLWFLASGNSQNLLLVDHSTENIPQDISLNMDVNIPINKDLTVVKVDADNNQIKLANVGFIFYNQETGQYLTQINGEYAYTSDRSQAKEFVTNSQGKIILRGIMPGTYVAYETKNPNEGYGLIDGGITIPIDSEEQTIENKLLYIKLSGYVWQDIQSEKQSIRNDYYQKDEADDKDARMEGITVRLMQNGNVVKDPITGRDQITQTDSNGVYGFENVEIDNLSNYYVEFTYDGLTYQNVTPHLDADNGSKAVESVRQEFNNRFAYVEKGNSDNIASIKDSSGNEQATVEYEFEQMSNGDGRTANIVKKNNVDLTADTKTAGFVIEYVRGSGVTEITNINLGLYARTQADLALQNELDQVKVEIEGYGHIYKYGSNFNTSDPSEVEKSWNLGVRFENPYKNVYKRPIYRADAEYDNEDESRELKVALTYKITMANQSSLTAKVNSIVDYFDSRYTVKGVGTGVSETDGSILNPIPYTESEYKDTYKKLEIDTSTLLGETAQGTTADKVTQSAIYIQFDLSRENILNMLNDANIYENDENKLEEAGKNLKTTAEITSYTSYADAQGTVLYAAVDTDSVPGNARVEDYSTYEDDTDKASSLAIVIANAREISGTIFEDLEDQNLKDTKNISQGDGSYDAETENTIGGVKVELVKVDANGNVTDEVAKVYNEQAVNDDGSIGAWTDANVEAVTDSDGNYAISGFIPGKYALKYTWGDGSYKIVDGVKGDNYESMVENYKATVIDYDKSNEESNNSKFYRNANESEVRTSHAMDDIDTRKEVDEALKNYNYEYDQNKNEAGTQLEMTSTTPMMEFNIEYDDNDLMSIDLNRVENRIAFKINNMDFGIIRRPEQSVNFVKTLSEIRLTLANGQVLIDAKVENGQLVGEVNHATYMAPRKENGITVDNGYLRIEMDESLIQGSTVQMTFKLTTENTSQADYVDEEYGYYQYGESYYQKAVGEEEKDNDIITLTPSKIVDYLDPKSVYRPDDETNIEYQWKQTSIEELRNEGLVAGNITDALESGEYDTGRVDGNGNPIIEELDESQIFTTDYLDDAKLKPIYSKGDNLNPAQGGDVYMVVDKVLSSSEDADFQNQAELVMIGKPGGGKITSTPGNYIPNKQQKETDDSTSQEVTITPSTGENRAYVIPVTVGIVAFVVLGVGIVLIRKKVLSER